MTIRTLPLLTAILLGFCFARAAIAADTCPPLTEIAVVDMHPLHSGGPVTVDVTLVNRPSRLLLDTGGASRSITDSVFRELGLHAQESFKLTNVAGRVADRATVLPSITFGGATVKNVQFQVGASTVEGDLLTTNRGFDGIFTMDLFHGVDFDLDFGANKLHLFKTDHCRGKVVYWQASAIADIPFTLDGAGHIQLRVNLDGSSLDAILDTGATGTTLEQSIATGHFNVDLSGPDVDQVAEVREGRPVYRRRFKTLSLDGITISNPMMMIVPNLMGRDEAVTGSHIIRDHSASLPPVILGMDVLHKLHIYIATKEGHLYITPVAEKTAQSTTTQSATPQSISDTPAQPSFAGVLGAAGHKCGPGAFRNQIGIAVREAIALYNDGKDAAADARLGEARALGSLTDAETCLLDSAQAQLHR